MPYCLPDNQRPKAIGRERSDHPRPCMSDECILAFREHARIGHSPRSTPDLGTRRTRL